MREQLPVARFECPNCAAHYWLVRVEADTTTVDREVTCKRCDGPLRGREGSYVLKYLLVDQPKVQRLRRR